MRSKLILICAVLAISLLWLACSPAPKGVTVEASCDDFTALQHISKEVQVGIGDSLTATLCSNPTTGFQWTESAQISDPSILQQTHHEYVPSEGEGVVGAPGKEVWAFEALQKGTCSVSLEYSRPWEGGEEGAWTFTLTVVVK